MYLLYPEQRMIRQAVCSLQWVGRMHDPRANVHFTCNRPRCGVAQSACRPTNGPSLSLLLLFNHAVHVHRMYWHHHSGVTHFMYGSTCPCVCVCVCVRALAEGVGMLQLGTPACRTTGEC